MSKPVVEVQVRAVGPDHRRVCCLCRERRKIFVIYVDQTVGQAITMFMRGAQKERPLTHDLMANILMALGARIERIVINDLKRGTYFARMILSAENELHQRKVMEIDARPERLHRHGGTTKGGDIRQSRSLGRGGRYGGCAAQNGRRRIQSGRIRRRVLKVPLFFSCRLQLKMHHLVCGIMSDSWDIPSAISLYNVDRWDRATSVLTDPATFR